MGGVLDWLPLLSGMAWPDEISIHSAHINNIYIYIHITLYKIYIIIIITNYYYYHHHYYLYLLHKIHYIYIYYRYGICNDLNADRI